VTTIDPHQRLAAALQQQLRALRERARAQATRSASAAPRVAASRLSPPALQRLARIEAADPDRRRKAVRIYLEGELAREFGDAVLNDPALPQMLDSVQDQMHADAQAADAVHALGELLLAGRIGS
jgi:hypothetical protein